MLKKISISVITHNFPSNEQDRQNAGIFVYDISRALSKGNDVLVLAPGNVETRNKVGDVETLFFKSPTGRPLGQLRYWNLFDWFRLMKFFIEGIRTIRRETGQFARTDFTIAMWAFPSGVFAYFLKKSLDIPYGIWALGSDIYVYAKVPILKTLIQKILKNADLLIADGIDLSKEVEKLSGKKCYFLPSASDMPTYTAVKSAHNLDTINLVFIGRMEMVKGIDILIDSLISIQKKDISYIIHIIGDGSLLEQLKLKKADNRQIEFVFHGNLNDKNEIYRIIKNSDWLVIPSRSDSIPLVFSESMKAGTPVIVSSLPDMTYLVDKYQVGLIFKSGSTQSLTKTLESLPNIDDQRKKFQLNTKMAAKIFDIKQSADSLIKLIESRIKK